MTNYNSKQEVPREEAIQQLWNLFIENIKNNWVHLTIGEGEPIEFDGGKGVNTNIAKAIHSDILTYLKNEKINIEQISWDSIYRPFTRGGFSKRSQDKTLDFVSHYLGYGYFSDFTEKLKNQLINQDKIEKKTVVSKADVINKRGKSKKKIIAIFVVILLIVLSISFSWQQLNKASPTEDLKSLIENANRAEFAGYRYYLTAEVMEDIDRYFTFNGTAKKHMIGLLNSMAQKNYKLVMPQSYQTLIDIDIIEKNDTVIKLKTTEKWYLLWCIPDKPEGLEYDILNEQDYNLKLEDNKWKVDYNHYKGGVNTPAAPPVCDF